MKGIKIGWFLLVGLFILFSFRIGAVEARMKMKRDQKVKASRNFKLSADIPFTQQRVHRVGLLQLCVTNWGIFGSRMRHPYLLESEGGCFMPNPDEEVEAPSAEYPAGSGLEYLFQGGLWIGAVVDDFAYTTLGCDGWQWIYEMWPDKEPEGAITEKSIRPTAACYSPDAISEQDVIAVYTDTSADIPLSPQQRDPFDNRKHFPLDIQITQKSYSWSYEYAEDFLLIDFTIKNIGFKKIKEMYMGFYVDADVQHIDESPYGTYGPRDDICGFRHLVTAPKEDCSDTVNLAWIADNDGHGDRDGGAGAKVFSSKSPIAVTGIRVVRSPKPGLKYSFNWWVSNQAGSPRDWGPWKAENQSRWESMNPYGSGNLFPDGVLGTPGGDVSKYFIMSNQEFDYDQIYSCVWPDRYPEEGWLPVNMSICDDLADGFDTRYLLSFGPFDELGPGESLMITIGYIAGDDFHVDPQNLKKNRNNPDEFYANLDFSDFETNATWAAKVYDNPDPDFPCGDGIPDFKGPPPPLSPTLSFETELCKVKIRWNGKITERTRDSFNGRLDFEGYRIYASRTGFPDDYALLGSYDKIDYKLYKLNRDKVPRVWDWKAASVKHDSLRSWLEGKGLEPFGDDPLVWTKFNPFVISPLEDTFFIDLSDSLDENGVPVVYQSIMLAPRDSLYFESQDWNVGFDSIVVYPAYRDSVDLGLVTDTADHYWDYEYEIEVLAESLYFSVTSFDVGDPQTGLPPLESSKLVNATLVYPCRRGEICDFFLTPKKLNVERNAEHTFMIHLRACESMDVSKGDSAEVYVDVDGSCTFDNDERYPAVVNSPSMVIKVYCPDLVDNDPKVGIYSVNNIPISDTLGNDIVMYLDTFAPKGKGPKTTVSPDQFTLGQNSPNPFNPACEIAYALPTECQVTLIVYNLIGQKVRVLVDEYQNAGNKSVKWDGTDDQGREVTSGVYFYRIQAGDFVQSKKMVLMK